MKKVYLAVIIVFVVLLSTGCNIPFLKATPEEQAYKIMCDIQNCDLDMDEEEVADKAGTQEDSMYDFYDLFSDDAYQKFGNLHDAYEKLHRYFDNSIEKFDLLEHETDGESIKAKYRFFCGDKPVYIYFIANTGDSIHKRGINYMHIADNKETIEDTGETGYGIYLNGDSLVSDDASVDIQLKDFYMSYDHDVSFDGGDEDKLLKEVAETLVENLKNKDGDRIKHMFSGSVWKYDSKLEEEIGELVESYRDVEILSYEVNGADSGGATSVSYLLDSKGTNHVTSGHGNYYVSGSIEMKTNQGEQEIDLYIISEYEPNSGRVGLWCLTGNVNVGIDSELR
ncbi:MAG: DUF5104 domain-containing protein [Lachnospiraceae bacterium]|nr:DUF5104 domain-containing protein [Lachnospiraceae bacterium]